MRVRKVDLEAQDFFETVGVNYGKRKERNVDAAPAMVEAFEVVQARLLET